MLTYSEINDMSSHLSFKIKDFKLPMNLTDNHIQTLLVNNETDNPPSHMYM